MDRRPICRVDDKERLLRRFWLERQTAGVFVVALDRAVHHEALRWRIDELVIVGDHEVVERVALLGLGSTLPQRATLDGADGADLGGAGVVALIVLTMLR